MATSKAQVLAWVVLLVGVAAAAGGFWYWHQTTKSHGRMATNMPGMEMGSVSMGTPAKSTQVPGHAEVRLPSEIQQRIGVTVGQVEEAPLRMSVRTVGIVKPNETKVAEVHLKTEGWVHQL